MNESGAFTTNVVSSLKDYFNYSGTSKLIYAKDFNNEIWNQMIYNDLKVGHVVFFAGLSSRFNYASGHAFLIDGYSQNDYFI